MRVRMILVAIALVASAGGVGTATATTSHSRSLRVAGLAGTSYWVDVTSGTLMGGVYADVATSTASNGLWSGVAIVRPSRDPVSGRDTSQLFAGFDLPDALRCPGTKCPWSAPPPTATGSADGSLAQGRYRLILLGSPGAKVTATVTPLKGRITLVPHMRTRQVAEVSSFNVAVGTVGHETVLHTFSSIPADPGWGLVLSMPMFDIQPAGFIADESCMVAGSTDSATSSLGGVVPCEDPNGGGFTFFTQAEVGPSIGPTPVAPSEGYVSPGAPLDASWGAHPHVPMGVGWEFSAAGPTTYLRCLFVGFNIPY